MVFTMGKLIVVYTLGASQVWLLNVYKISGTCMDPKSSKVHVWHVCLFVFAVVVVFSFNFFLF